MAYRVSVYWAAGKSAWQGSLDENEIVYQATVRWLWLARAVARSNRGNQGKLAHVIHDENGVVEELPA